MKPYRNEVDYLNSMIDEGIEIFGEKVIQLPWVPPITFTDEEAK